jgi:hypothetical protein
VVAPVHLLVAEARIRLGLRADHQRGSRAAAITASTIAS